MLPAWATVAIAIGGSLIVALTGVLGSYFALRGTNLTLRSHEGEAWRTRLIEAATAYAERWNELGFVVGLVVEGSRTPDADWAQDVDTAVIPYLHASIRVSLLFGEGSPVGKHSEDAWTASGKMRIAVRKLAATDEDSREDVLEEVDEHFTTASEANENFMSAAHTAIRPVHTLLE